ncbi:MAG: hypothetical protein L0H84_21585, partial [Pseudonocardia sp.]|nr:hypothetical protein [Pseudonocardia sp.]
MGGFGDCDILVDMPNARTYEDRRPVAVPVALRDLGGPTQGMVELPASIAWTGRRQYDLDDPADVRILYERVIVEATDADTLIRFLDPVWLRSMWSELFLPIGVRQAWEQRF